jgi:hypothetical protein
MTPQPARLAPPTRGGAVHGELAVQPGDEATVEQVQEWFRVYHAGGDPAIRERIIVAHLQLADRLASRFRGRPRSGRCRCGAPRTR